MSEIKHQSSTSERQSFENRIDGISASIRRFDVSLTVSSFNNGTYTIASGSANTLPYIDFAGNTLYASSGSIRITAYSASSISGNFAATINDISGVTRSITGSFVNTPVEP